MPASQMTADELRLHLAGLQGRTNEEWLASLNRRKQEELKFHDDDRNPDQAKKSETDDHARDSANRKYYLTTKLSKDWTRDWIAEHARGKVVLDYACGNGVHAMLAAEAGASLSVGLDISSVSVQNCREIAGQRKLANAVFVQGDCEHTGLPDNSIDVVICSGMLHHLDLSYALFELRRIMKPGGVLLGIEALNYNPVIKLYRQLTPDLRTEFEKEHILSLKDLDFASRFFEVRRVCYWHLFSIGAIVFRKTPLFGPALAMANGIDKVALRVPGLRLMAWMFTFELVKEMDD